VMIRVRFKAAGSRDLSASSGCGQGTSFIETANFPLKDPRWITYMLVPSNPPDRLIKDLESWRGKLKFMK
jgi:hypothetical protein